MLGANPMIDAVHELSLVGVCDNRTATDHTTMHRQLLGVDLPVPQLEHRTDATSSHENTGESKCKAIEATAVATMRYVRFRSPALCRVSSVL